MFSQLMAVPLDISIRRVCWQLLGGGQMLSSLHICMLLALARMGECGFVCTGVLDLVSQQVTHLYCPWEDPQSLSARDHHRLPAWGPNGGPYCFSTISGVTLLDFGSGRASPCAVSGGQTSETLIHLVLGMHCSYHTCYL
jgi:hypothetical protein